MKMKGTGYFQTYVGSQVTSLPIKDAHVCVYSEEGEMLLSLYSEENGMIFKSPLPTPTRDHQPPYIRYRVVAQAPNFEEKTMEIAFFEGVTSYQTFFLPPLGKICENSNKT